MAIYEHDCSKCELVFSINMGNDRDVDVYFCPGSLGGSIVIRYSDEGSQYWSMDRGTIRANLDLLIREDRNLPGEKRQSRALSGAFSDMNILAMLTGMILERRDIQEVVRHGREVVNADEIRTIIKKEE